MNESRVAVAVRIRPLLGKEQVDRCTTCVEVLSETELLMGGDKQFTFDHVYSSLAEQSTVYEESVAPLVDNFVNGYNTTVLAYGQTGSGKTFTMGSGCGAMAADGTASESNIGIIPRATAQVFDLISQRRQVFPTVEFYLRVQFLELYGECLRDLLDPVGTARGKVVSIRDGPNDSLQVVGATEDVVKCPGDMIDLLDRGTLCRTTGSTDMNSHSSRSHAIFTIILEQHLKSEDEAEETEYRISKFHFVDLAGSERAKRTRATGQRLKEGININMGLLALGNVISALGAEEAATMNRFVPYRDSKLTRMLQDSLGGNSRTLMIACVSPADCNFEETLNALRYANRARNIKNRAIINRDPKASQIAALKAQIAALKLQIQHNHQQQHHAEEEAGQATGASSTPNLGLFGGNHSHERNKLLEAEVTRLIELYEHEKRIKNELQDRCFVLEAERVALLGLDAQEEDDEDEEDEDEEQVLLIAALEKETGQNRNTLRLSDASFDGGSGGGDGDVGGDGEGHDAEELQQKFEKSQKHLRRIVNKYDETLKSKQDAMAQIMEEKAKYEALKIHFESKMAEMNEEVRETQHQRDALEGKLRVLESVEHSKQTDTSKSEALKLRTQLAEKDKRLRELEDRTRQLNDARKNAAEWQKKESVVRMEIEHFKREKVEYQRKLNENQKRYIDELKERRLEIAGLKRERARLEQDTNKLTQRTDRDLKLIQQKSEQVAAMQRKLREAQRLTFHPQALSDREKKQRVEIERLASLQVKREEELLDLRRALAKKEDAISRRDRLLAQLERLRHPIVVHNTSAASPQQVTIMVPEATEEDVRELEQRLEAVDSEIVFRDLKCREVLEKPDDYSSTTMSAIAEEGEGTQTQDGHSTQEEEQITVNFTTLDQAREVCQVLMQMFVESKRELRERKNELAKVHDQFLTQDQKVKIERRRTETLLGGGGVAGTSPSSKKSLSSAPSASLVEEEEGGAPLPLPPPPPTTQGLSSPSPVATVMFSLGKDGEHAVGGLLRTPEKNVERKARDVVLDSEVRIKTMEATLRSLRVEDAASGPKRRSPPSLAPPPAGVVPFPPLAPSAPTTTTTTTTTRHRGGWENVVDRLTSPSNATGIHKYGKRVSQVLPAIHSTPHFAYRAGGEDDDRMRRPGNLPPTRNQSTAALGEEAAEGRSTPKTTVSTETMVSPKTMMALSSSLPLPSGLAPVPPPAPVHESSYMRMTESQRNKQQLDAEARKSSSLFHLRSSGYSMRTSPPPSTSNHRMSKTSSLPPFLPNSSAATVVPGKENANALLSKTLADERKKRRNRLTASLSVEGVGGAVEGGGGNSGSGNEAGGNANAVQ
ncbi:hypothetical protein BASA81_002477 [Batrachochytrium salamandrivorans]|nr:hypothetical protein BASA81_002477 [Batrachochytrium salamandrivorans]